MKKFLNVITNVVRKLSDVFKPVFSVWVAVAVSTITYAGIVYITLSGDAVLAYLVKNSFVDPDKVTLMIFKTGEYIAVGLEVAAYIYAIIKELRK